MNNHPYPTKHPYPEWMNPKHFAAWEELRITHPELFARWFKQYLNIYPNHSEFLESLRKTWDELGDTRLVKVTDEQRDAMVAQIGTGHSWLWMMDELYCYPFEDRVLHTYKPVTGEPIFLSQEETYGGRHTEYEYKMELVCAGCGQPKTIWGWSLRPLTKENAFDLPAGGVWRTTEESEPDL